MSNLICKITSKIRIVIVAALLVSNAVVNYIVFNSWRPTIFTGICAVMLIVDVILVIKEGKKDECIGNIGDNGPGS